jgi:hypothetical protein
MMIGGKPAGARVTGYAWPKIKDTGTTTPGRWATSRMPPRPTYVVESNGILNGYDRAIFDRPHQKAIEHVHRGEKRAVDRGHGNKLTLDKFDPLVLAENAGLTHLVIVGHAQRTNGNRRGMHENRRLVDIHASALLSQDSGSHKRELTPGSDRLGNRPGRCTSIPILSTRVRDQNALGI